MRENVAFVKISGNNILLHFKMGSKAYITHYCIHNNLVYAHNEKIYTRGSILWYIYMCRCAVCAYGVKVQTNAHTRLLYAGERGRSNPVAWVNHHIARLDWITEQSADVVNIRIYCLVSHVVEKKKDNRRREEELQS